MSDDFIEELILEGSVEPSAISNSGEMLYSFTKNIESLRPEIYDSLLEYQRLMIMALWEMGFVSMNPTELNPTLRLTEKAFDSDEVDRLHDDLKATIFNIIQATKITDIG